MEFCQIFLFLFLYYEKVLAAGGFLKPNSPVRRVGEFLVFDCQSPTGYVANNPDITVYILHNDTMLETVSHSVLQHSVAKAEYKVTDIDGKSAGKWECTISGVSFSQELIVIEGDSSPAVVEMNHDGRIDCLTSIDKTRPIIVEWLVDSKPADWRFKPDGFSLKVSKPSVKDGQKNFSCLVKARNSSGAQLDESSYTRVNKPVSLVGLEKCAESANCSFQVRVCGWTNMSVSWYINSTFIHGSTKRSPDTISDCVYYSTNETDPGLQVCMGDMKTTNLWCKNMRDIEQEAEEDQSPVRLVPIVLGVIVIAIVIVIVTVIVIGVIVWRCRKQTNKKKGQENHQSHNQDDKQEEKVPLKKAERQRGLADEKQIEVSSEDPQDNKHKENISQKEEELATVTTNLKPNESRQETSAQCQNK